MLCFSTQADDRVRVEKRNCAQFEFASAMNTVTEFYCHSQEKGVFIFLFNLLYSVFGPATHSQQDRCLRVLLCLTVAPVCFCLWKLHVCVSVSPKAAARCQVWPPWRARWSAVWVHSFSIWENLTWREFLEVKGTQHKEYVHTLELKFELLGSVSSPLVRQRGDDGGTIGGRDRKK